MELLCSALAASVLRFSKLKIIKVLQCYLWFNYIWNLKNIIRPGSVRDIYTCMVTVFPQILTNIYHE